MIENRKLNWCENVEAALVETRHHLLRLDDDIADYWLGPCVGSPDEIPGLAQARMEQIHDLQVTVRKLKDALKAIESATNRNADWMRREARSALEKTTGGTNVQT